jgi:hypothetical protein
MGVLALLRNDGKQGRYAGDHPTTLNDCLSRSHCCASVDTIGLDCDGGSWHDAAGKGAAEQVCSAPVVQTSTSSAIVRASSTSIPRYRTAMLLGRADQSAVRSAHQHFFHHRCAAYQHCRCSRYHLRQPVAQVWPAWSSRDCCRYTCCALSSSRRESPKSSDSHRHTRHSVSGRTVDSAPGRARRCRSPHRISVFCFTVC